MLCAPSDDGGAAEMMLDDECPWRLKQRLPVLSSFFINWKCSLKSKKSCIFVAEYDCERQLVSNI
jgi:hypothetical protein